METDLAAVVMVTVTERMPMLIAFLRSLARYQPGMPVALHMQGNNADAAARQACEAAPQVTICHRMVSSTRMGCHAARVALLRSMPRFPVYVNVDDDVQLLPWTRWGPAIERARQGETDGTGFVLTNWVSSQRHLDAKVPRLAPVFDPQVLVYQGGGMAYSDAVADLMRELPQVPARYDDIWPLTAYLAGYRNYRYLGSLALHSIMARGGMSAYMRSEPRPLLCWEWIAYRLLNGQPVGMEYAIPADRDLRPRAHEQHRKMRTERGWVTPRKVRTGC